MKAAREKRQITYKGTPIRLTADFSAETLQGKNLKPRLLYLARISFIFDGEIKSFADKQKLREFSSTTNAKGTPLSGKHKRRKGPTKETHNN